MKKILITFIFISAFSSCATSNDPDYYQQEPYPDYEEPYSGYSDGYDQDCIDIGREVQVPYDDPDGLDADGDGWGCETYGG